MVLKHRLQQKHPLREESGFESGNRLTLNGHHLVLRRLFIGWQTVSQSHFSGPLFTIIGMVELGLLDLKERAYQVVHPCMRICLMFTRMADIAHSEITRRREYSIRGILSIFCDILGRSQGSSQLLP
jgi:hypothetical protein